MATPLKLSAADRTHPTPWDGAVALAICLVAGLCLFLFAPRAGGAPASVEVVREGEVLLLLDLKEAEGRTIAFDDLPYPLTLACADGAVWVTESDCPGGDCLHAGPISKQGQQIICLPNRLIVRLEGVESVPFDAQTH